MLPPTFSWSKLTQHFWCDFLGFSSISSHGFMNFTHGISQESVAVCGSGTALGEWSVANALELDAGARGHWETGRLEVGMGQRLGKVWSFHVIFPRNPEAKSRLPRLVQGDGETGACDGLAFQEQDGIDSFACDTPRWHEDETWRNREIKQVGPFKLGLEGHKHN